MDEWDEYEFKISEKETTFENETKKEYKKALKKNKNLFTELQVVKNEKNKLEKTVEKLNNEIKSIL